METLILIKRVMQGLAPNVGKDEYGHSGCLFKALSPQNPDMCCIYLCTLPFWLWSVPKVHSAHRVQWDGLSFSL